MIQDSVAQLLQINLKNSKTDIYSYVDIVLSKSYLLV